MIQRAVVMTLVLASLLACGSDPAPANGGACPADCLPPAPDGWTGPSAVFDGASEPSACPEAYAAKEVVAHDDLKPGVGTCACGEPAFATLECKVTVTTYSGSTECLDTEVVAENIVSTKAACAATTDASLVRVSAAELTPTTCTFGPSERTDPLTFGRTAVACGPSRVAECKDRPDCTGAPAVTAPFTKMCIHRVGTSDCPNADYANRFVLFSKVKDERVCTDCTGGDATGGCGDTFETTIGECEAPGAPAKAMTCVKASAAVSVFKMRPQLTCPQTTTPIPSGAATLEESVTFCCTR